MTNEELKVKIDEYLVYSEDDIHIEYIEAILSILKVYTKFGRYARRFKYSDIDYEGLSNMDLETTIKLVKELYKENSIPFDEEYIDKIISNGVIDFKFDTLEESDLSRVKYDKLTTGSTGVKKGKRFLNSPSTGKITDPIILAHELGHYTVGVSENDKDHYMSEMFAIFMEFLMEEKLKDLGYASDVREWKKTRIISTWRCASSIFEELLLLNVYLKFGDFSRESFNEIYTFNDREYDLIIKNNKDIFKRRENEEDKDYYERVDYTKDLRYIFGTLIGSFMCRSYLNDNKYYDRIKKAFSYPTSEYFENFLDILGITYNSFNEESSILLNELFDNNKTL